VLVLFTVINIPGSRRVTSQNTALIRSKKSTTTALKVPSSSGLHFIATSCYISDQPPLESPSEGNTRIQCDQNTQETLAEHIRTSAELSSTLTAIISLPPYQISLLLKQILHGEKRREKAKKRGKLTTISQQRVDTNDSNDQVTPLWRISKHDFLDTSGSPEYT
jgi:hypothetical protein